MIGRNHLVEIKRIKELTLSFFPSPHHALLPPMPSPPTESWFAIRIKGSFATQSCVKQTSPFINIRLAQPTCALAVKDDLICISPQSAFDPERLLRERPITRVQVS
jgi:hypothetical protein